MKRIQYDRYGGPELLYVAEVEPPRPGRGQVLVRVRAASLNPMDGKIRRGEMKMLSGRRFPRGLGHEFAGIVEAVGAGVSGVAAGDAVLGVTAIPKAAAIAELVVADARHVTAKPSNVTFPQAAAMTIIGLTAWNALVENGRLKGGKTIFIAGCMGGVGRSAVQLARMLGATVVGSCSASDRSEALDLGVSEVVDYRSFDPVAFRRRFDLVFDTFGSLGLRTCASMLTERGRSAHIVPTAAKFVGCALSRRHHLVFGNPSPSSFAGITEAAAREVLVPLIGREVLLAHAVPAIAAQEKAGALRGKLVIDIDSDADADAIG